MDMLISISTVRRVDVRVLTDWYIFKIRDSGRTKVHVQTETERYVVHVQIRKVQSRVKKVQDIVESFESSKLTVYSVEIL